MIHARVVEPVQQVDRARPRGGQAHPDLSGELGVGAGHEGRHLLVAHADIVECLGAPAHGAHDPVDAIAGVAEDALHPTGSSVRAIDRQPCWTFSPPGRVWGRTSEDWHRGRGFKAIERRCRRRNRLNCRHRRPAQGTGPAWAQSPGGAAMTRAINDPGNEDPGSLLKPTPTPCSAVPPPRRRKSAAGSRPRTASARASATWRSAPSPAGNNASTPATAPTSAASPLCCWSAAAHGRRPPASWRRAMPWHARSVAMATSRWSANVRVPAGASSRPVGRCCRPEAGHFLPLCC